MENSRERRPERTFALHKEYLREIARLKLFFVHNYLSEHESESFEHCLRERVDIYRKTNINPEGLNPRVLHFDSPLWLGLERKAKEIYLKNINDAPAFEEEAYRLFSPTIEERAMRDFLDGSRLLAYQCGSLRHELGLSGEDTLYFHIANAITPRSIFEDPSYLKGCFTRLLNSARALGASRIACNSWLNSYERWLALFPREWQENASDEDTDVKWHYGYWGQFITSSHGFNYKHGKILRETGRLPYYPRTASCTVEAMQRKLDGAE